VGGGGNGRLEHKADHPRLVNMGASIYLDPMDSTACYGDGFTLLKLSRYTSLVSGLYYINKL
jgi:hypothetical protein